MAGVVSSLSTHPHISLIVPTRNHAQMLKRLVKGLELTAQTTAHSLELIVVDNNSNETAAIDYLQELSNTKKSTRLPVQLIHYPKKFNYSIINNLAAEQSSAQYLCFLNNDLEIIKPDWLDAMLEPMQQADTGCVGAKLYYPDDTIQHAGVYLHPDNIAGHLYKHEEKQAKGREDFLQNQQILNAVTAACLLVKRSVFKTVGGFEPALPVAFNDVDFCLKVQAAGYKNIWTPRAELYHHESKSRGKSHERGLLQKFNHRKAVRYMQRKWKSQLASDPFLENHV